MESSHYRTPNNYLPPGRIYRSHYRTPNNYLPPGRLWGTGEFHPGQTKVFTIELHNAGQEDAVLAGLFLCLVDDQNTVAKWSSGMEGSVVTLPPGATASLSGIMVLPAAGPYGVILLGTKTVGSTPIYFEVDWSQPIIVNDILR